MKRDRLGFILVAFIALYNFLLFIITMDVLKTPVFWISYVFIMLPSVILTALMFTPIKFTAGTNFIFSIPQYRVLLIYAIVEFFVGTLFMFLQTVASVKAALLVQVPILIIAGIAFMVVLFSAQHVSESYAKQKADVFSLGQIQTRVVSIANSAPFPALSAKLATIAEKIKYSDYNRYAENADIENEIKLSVNMIYNLFDDEAAAMREAVKLEMLIDERNANCKQLKKMRG